ncbi:MAG: choice-of-anchor A family protein, partial [Lachnospiraceae bacterium]|nr:choice-of-anchor A family protein [Lachnospiraceae bacterium]
VDASGTETVTSVTDKDGNEVEGALRQSIIDNTTVAVTYHLAGHEDVVVTGTNTYKVTKSVDKDGKETVTIKDKDNKPVDKNSELGKAILAQTESQMTYTLEGSTQVVTKGGTYSVKVEVSTTGVKTIHITDKDGVEVTDTDIRTEILNKTDVERKVKFTLSDGTDVGNQQKTYEVTQKVVDGKTVLEIKANGVVLTEGHGPQKKEYDAVKKIAEAQLATISGSSTYTLTGTYNGQPRTITYADGSDIPVYKVGDKYYVKDTENGKEIFVEVTGDIKEHYEGQIIKGKTFSDVSGSDVSAEMQADIINLLKNVSITSNFVLYGEEIITASHFDGNICTLDLDLGQGSPWESHDFYASGRGTTTGLDKYSIILNNDGDKPKFGTLNNDAIVVGTNIDAGNRNGDSVLIDIGDGEGILKKAASKVINAITSVVGDQSSDNCTNKQLKAIIYSIVEQEGFKDDLEAVKKYSAAILRQVNIKSTLSSITDAAKKLIDDSVSELKSKYSKFDSSVSASQLSSLKSTLKNKADGSGENEYYTVTVTVDDITKDDNSSLQDVLKEITRIKANVVINVYVENPDSVTGEYWSQTENAMVRFQGIKLGQCSAGTSDYDAENSNIYWNFGNFSKLIVGNNEHTGTVIASNASYNHANGSKDGAIIAKSIEFNSEVHQARARSFTPEEIYSYTIKPSTSSEKKVTLYTTGQAEGKIGTKGTGSIGTEGGGTGTIGTEGGGTGTIGTEGGGTGTIGTEGGGTGTIGTEGGGTGTIGTEGGGTGTIGSEGGGTRTIGRAGGGTGTIGTEVAGTGYIGTEGGGTGTIGTDGGGTGTIGTEGGGTGTIGTEG